MTNKELNNKVVNTLLTMVNMLDEDEKLFIKENILFKGEPWPIGYRKLFIKDEMTWQEIRKAYYKAYGYKWIVDDKGNKKHIINNLDPIPEGYKLLKD